MAGGAKGDISHRTNASLLLFNPIYLSDSTSRFKLWNVINRLTLYRTNLMDAIGEWGRMC